FADLNEKGFYSDGFGRNDWGPKIALAPEKDKARVQELDQQISAVRQELERVSDEHLAGELVEWEKKVLEGEASGTLEWNHPKPTSIESSGGATLMIQDDQSVLSSGSNPQIDDYTITVPVPLGRLTAIRLESLRDESLLGNSIARSGTTFYISEVVAELISSTRESQPIKISHAFADYAQDGFPVLGTIDQNSSTAWAVEGGHAGTKRAVFVPEEPLNIPEGSHLKVTIRHSRKHPRQHIGRFRIGVTSNEFSGVDRFGISEDVLKAIKTPASERKEDQQKAITAAYRRVSPSLKVNRVTLARLEAERNQITGQWPTTLVSQSKEPRTIRVLPRGNWMDDSGEEVGPAVPGFLPQLETSGRPSRLDLAHWFTSRENPLTARVFVNRLWKLYFGTGISKTLDDFGAQGEWPTHPELLDWLATEFMDTGWNIKQMVRTMVLSRTYRQASTSSRELDEKDPYNRLLARQSRFRLDAELVRDNALAISGLLVDKQGGPSTHPYQPPGYYAALNFPKREYVEDVSEGLYRRGLYVHWQRTFLHPSLLAFDAPSREECTVNRVNSNTPLQALVLLNDPTYVEAARVFAANLVREQKGFQPRLNLAFAKTVARSPSRKETELLKKLFEKEFKQYSKSTDAAHQLLSVGEAPVATDLNPAEVAAWTSVTRSLLNLHETITRN
ncbi:MAG: DUF1553 domain-containing protein, partial [Verrucomicrobiota bacterium]|nr:DUF1553 domain-containing protein [Verrucomicrobiota bacterium]